MMSLRRPARLRVRRAQDHNCMSPVVGDTISRYRIVSRLGGGGMGVVFGAEDLKLGRRVALKFLPPELTQNREAVSRFQREARTASALNHPHICTIHDLG